MYFDIVAFGDIATAARLCTDGQTILTTKIEKSRLRHAYDRQVCLMFILQINDLRKNNSRIETISLSVIKKLVMKNKEN